MHWVLLSSFNCKALQNVVMQYSCRSIQYSKCCLTLGGPQCHHSYIAGIMTPCTLWQEHLHCHNVLVPVFVSLVLGQFLFFGGHYMHSVPLHSNSSIINSYQHGTFSQSSWIWLLHSWAIHNTSLLLLVETCSSLSDLQPFKSSSRRHRFSVAILTRTFKLGFFLVCCTVYFKICFQKYGVTFVAAQFGLP